MLKPKTVSGERHLLYYILLYYECLKAQIVQTATVTVTATNTQDSKKGIRQEKFYSS